MQSLIANYLFQYKKCVLPDIGTLEIQSTEAGVISGEKKITPRVPSIIFTDQFTDSGDLQHYISVNKEISNEEADYQLNNFCKDLNALQKDTQLEIPGAGNFYVTHSGKLSFDPVIIPQNFLPEVQAERMIHNNTPHAILVGDTETTNAAMEEFFKEEKPAVKSKRWVWAVLLILIAASAIIFYMNNKNSNAMFGTSQKPDVKPAPATYRKIP